MAFQGSLKELPLPDIIQLVAVSGKTGKFTLAKENERGYIYLKAGQMIDAQVGELVGEEAIYALAIWNQGEFQFSAGEEASRQTINKSNTNLLMEAARRLDEWRVLSKKIPSIEMVPELQARAGRAEQITLNTQEWLLVTRIDGRRSIAEIAHLLEMSAFDVAKILYGMITAELVQLKKKADLSAAAHAENRQLIELATRIRGVAEQFLGRGHKSVERYYRDALDGIANGEGLAAIQAMVGEFEKTTSLVRGLSVGEQLRAQITELTSQTS
jgi:hypothetical protein